MVELLIVNRAPPTAPFFSFGMIFILMTKGELKQLITECVQEVLNEYDHQHIEDFYERRDEQMLAIVGDFLKGAKQISWPVIKADRLMKIWLV